MSCLVLGTGMYNNESELVQSCVQVKWQIKLGAQSVRYGGRVVFQFIPLCKSMTALT